MEGYWQAITMIEAQDILTNFMIQDWSHQKNDARSTLKRKVEASAYPRHHSKSEELTNEELAKRIQRAISG